MTTSSPSLPESAYDLELHTIDGEPTSLGAYRDRALLLVNVASFCGLTPHYEGLQRLQETYGDRGLTVLGFPCNQFGAQEPGTSEEIKTFCSTSYGVTFPLLGKIDVNGDDRHPLYAQLTTVPDQDGRTGDIQWNFEKFVVAPQGSSVHRFSPLTTPEDPALVAVVESALPS